MGAAMDVGYFGSDIGNIDYIIIVILETRVTGRMCGSRRFISANKTYCPTTIIFNSVSEKIVY